MIREQGSRRKKERNWVDKDDHAIENLLFPKTPEPINHPAPDMAQVHKELRRPGVTG